MSLLAEANNSVPGRWVLMPRKGARLVGPRVRDRVRARRRRRQVFMVLLETTALTLMMGLFPPFRVMLYGTGILAFVLLAYSALLVKIHEEELARVRHRRAMERQQAYQGVGPGSRARVAMAASPGYATPPGAWSDGNPNGNGHSNGSGNGHSNGHAMGRVRADGNGHAHSNGNGHANGNGNGHAYANGYSNGNGHGTLADILREGGVEIIDDDIHIVVRPAAEFAAEAARSSAR